MASKHYFELWEFIKSETAEKKGIDNTPTFEIVEHLQHGLIKNLAIGHATETVSRFGSKGFNVCIKLSQRHACISLCSSMGMLHVEMIRQRCAVSHEVSDMQGNLLDISWCLIFIGRVF